MFGGGSGGREGGGRFQRLLYWGQIFLILFGAFKQTDLGRALATLPCLSGHKHMHFLTIGNCLNSRPTKHRQ